MKKNIEINEDLLKSLEEAKKSDNKSTQEAVKALEIASRIMDSISSGKKIDVGYYRFLEKEIRNKILPSHELLNEFEANKKAIIEKLKSRKKKII